MEISDLTIDTIKTYIAGDEGGFPRLTGPEILKLFNKVGFKDIYDRTPGTGGMPNHWSRPRYVFERLMEINGKKEMQHLLEIVVSPEHFQQAPSLDLNSAVEVINAVLITDGFNFVDTGDGHYKIAGAVLPEAPKVEVHFEQIQSQIIAEIKKAKFFIWVAVAWLTDRVLLKELKEKQKEGVNIQIVAMDDEINSTLKPLVKHHFEAHYKLPKGVYKNLMHNKFCIIDMRTVIHGSYNWTVKAQYNEEGITITESTDVAAKFAATFMQLKQS